MDLEILRLNEEIRILKVDYDTINDDLRLLKYEIEKIKEALPPCML